MGWVLEKIQNLKHSLRRPIEVHTTETHSGHQLETVNTQNIVILYIISLRIVCLVFIKLRLCVVITGYSFISGYSMSGLEFADKDPG